MMLVSVLDIIGSLFIASFLTFLFCLYFKRNEQQTVGIIIITIRVIRTDTEIYVTITENTAEKLAGYVQVGAIKII